MYGECGLTNNNEWMCTHFKVVSHKSEHIFTAHKSQMPLKHIKLISETHRQRRPEDGPFNSAECQQSASYRSIHGTSLKTELQLHRSMSNN